MSVSQKQMNELISDLVENLRCAIWYWECASTTAGLIETSGPTEMSDLSGAKKSLAEAESWIAAESKGSTTPPDATP